MAQALANTESIPARIDVAIRTLASSVRRDSVFVDLSVSMSLLCRIECNASIVGPLSLDRCT